jgi:hypothetical protein
MAENISSVVPSYESYFARPGNCFDRGSGAASSLLFTEVQCSNPPSSASGTWFPAARDKTTLSLKTWNSGNF